MNEIFEDDRYKCCLFDRDWLAITYSATFDSPYDSDCILSWRDIATEKASNEALS